MEILYAVLGTLLGGAAVSLFLGKGERALKAASRAAVAASVAGFAFALYHLLAGTVLTGRPPVALPLGRCVFSVDPLSCFFLLPVFFLSAAGGLLMPARVLALEAHGPGGHIHYGRHGFFFCLFIAAMVLVLTASDAVFFLISWEIMSLTPFFLISPQDRDSKERYAAWIYLVAAHLGALPLLFMFAGMSAEAGSSEFLAFSAHALQGNAPGQAVLDQILGGSWLGPSGSGTLPAGAGWRTPGLFFVLALVGFGVKAGLAPVHIWMPEAHTSAPGHIAVLLSGAMLNLGLYGIARSLCLLGPVESWWAYALMGAGAFSGVFGILAALVQSDIKRTLAYSSMENMGIICLALGAGLLAALHGVPAAAALLLAGAFLHIWNHSLFKSLLFLGANMVKESVRATAIPRLGGLQRRLPVTGSCFAVGCAAIAGIPPLNGFMSELLVYMGFALGGNALRGSGLSLVFWVAFFILAAVAGMALFAFTRMYGLAFLGAARSEESRQARDPEPACKRILIFLAALCLGMSLAGPLLLSVLSPFVSRLAGMFALPAAAAAPDMHAGGLVLLWYSVAGGLLLLCVSLIFLARKKAVDKNGFTTGVTWDCGYRHPSARMQYSGGSFAHSLALMLKPLIRPGLEVPKVEGLFPAEPRAVMATPDWLSSLWSGGIFRPVVFLAEQAKDLQHGLVNVYILYIFIALMTALIWALGWS